MRAPEPNPRQTIRRLELTGYAIIAVLFGGVGVWVGLASGLVVAATLLMYRFWFRVIPAVTREVSDRLGIEAGSARPAGA